MIIHPHLMMGGAERQVLQLARHLSEKGDDISIVTLSVEDGLQDSLGKIEIITPSHATPYRFFRSTVDKYYYNMTRLLKLRNLVKKHYENFDVLNPHNFPSTLACTRLQRRVVWMCNEAPGFFKNDKKGFEAIARELILKIDKELVGRYINEICVIDELNNKAIQRSYGRASHVVYSGVDYEFFSNGKARMAIEKFGLDGNFVVLQVGQVTPQKNQERSILAIKNLLQFIPNIKLVIAGRSDNKYAEVLKKKVHSLDLDDHVIFPGAVTDNDICNLYAASNVVIFPTLQQTWGLSPLEALCANKLPIVSPYCGVAEVLAENKIGIVSLDLESGILNVYNKPEHYCDMINAGKAFIKSQLSWEAYSARMRRIFQDNNLDRLG